MDIRNTPWLKRRTTLEKCLLLVVAILFIICIVLLIKTLSSKSSESKDVCVSPSCIKSASTILNYLDQTVDPCDDFYQFTCGTYLKTTRIPEDKMLVHIFNTIEDIIKEQLKVVLEEPYRPDAEPKSFKLVKAFYKICNNNTLRESLGIQPALDLLKKVGGWPVLEGNAWNEDNFNWLTTLYKFRKLGLNHDYLMEFSVDRDLKYSQNRIISLDQTSFGLDRELIIAGRDNKLVMSYYKYMVNVAVELGAPREIALKEMQEVLDLEIELAKHAWSKQMRRDVGKLYNILTIAEMENKFPSIPWLEFFNTMLEPFLSVNKSEKILVIVPTYITKLEEIIRQTPKRVQSNYLLWRLTKSLVSYLSTPLRQLDLDFKHDQYGILERAPRWKECVEESINFFEYLSGSLYVRKYFGPEAKEDASDMVKYLKAQFQEILKGTTWMDPKTKRKALKKSEGFLAFIGYADELLDNQVLDQHYANLIFPDNDYMGASIAANGHSTEFRYSRLRKRVNISDWEDRLHPAQVNAYYQPLENSITFPAGILQNLFFDKERPRYLNYGAIGSVIGHEITHGFDDEGRQFDEQGNLVDWWAPETERAFLEKANCIIEQYTNYTWDGLHLNGNLTQGENIADNGGLKEAYLAYQSYVEQHGVELGLPGLPYNPNQLFWISFAMNWCAVYRPEMPAYLNATDSHSLTPFRVKGSVSNMDEFASDFTCALGTNMNPVKKCTIW